MLVWLDKREILYFHSELLYEHGGLAAPPDEGALESTLARPQNLLAHQPGCTIYEIAACYGYGFTQNHCFPDGNKRLALVSVDVFLQANGYELAVDEAEAVVALKAVAAGDLTERELAVWVESHSVPLR